jgi:hypothetical protein
MELHEFYLPVRHYGDQNKWDKFGRTCNTYRRNNNMQKVLSRNQGEEATLAQRDDNT